MASHHGAIRPCVQRALQACRPSPLNRTPPPAAFLPSITSSQAQIRLASSNAPLPPSNAGASAAAAAAAGGAGALEKQQQQQQKKKAKKKELPVVRRRPNRDHNKQRGLSVMRRTGPREVLSVSGLPLPRPISPEQFPAVKTDPNHGLWDFFYSADKPLNTPAEDSKHGRAWNVEELRRKSWDDLHRLWWVCCKERNRISTGNAERKKGGYGYGDVESREREVQVRKTQNAIKHALTERFYAWEDAVKLAEEDPEINFTEDGVQYVPGGDGDDFEAFFEDEVGAAHVKGLDTFMEEEGKGLQPENVDPSLPSSTGKSQQDTPRA